MAQRQTASLLWQRSISRSWGATSHYSPSAPLVSSRETHGQLWVAVLLFQSSMHPHVISYDSIINDWPVLEDRQVSSTNSLWYQSFTGSWLLLFAVGTR